MSRDKKEDFGFIQGWVAAVATMVKSHDIGVPAEEALRDLGVSSVADLKKYKCDEFDIETLRETLKSMKKTRNRQRWNERRVLNQRAKNE